MTGYGHIADIWHVAFQVAFGSTSDLADQGGIDVHDPQPTSELRELTGFPTPSRTDTLNRYHALS